MLNSFLAANREELIERCRLKVALRRDPRVTEVELKHGIPLFLDQLIKTLEIEQTDDPLRSREVSGPAGGQKSESAASEMGKAATEHGRELLQHGFTVEQVVHDYGDLCQAITDLATEHGAPISTDEFRTLNRCLDNGVAVAVTEFNYRRDFVVADSQTAALNERLGFFAHELRNQLNTATLAVAAMKAGTVGLSGATAGVLDRSLVGMSNLIHRTLTEVRLSVGTPAMPQLFPLSDLIAEAKLSGTLEAQVKGCTLSVSSVAPQLAVNADRDLLFAALGNLLHNAFKFTRPQTEVKLNAYASGDRVRIDVEDQCGGLPPGNPEDLFLPFKRAGGTNPGLGLGLTISRTSVTVNGGFLTIRNKPGSGCVFTIDLPRHSTPEPIPVSLSAVSI